ncbi:MAG: PAS domain-containing protein [Kiritimatiellales bacterium]|nr:PAS domain-containing protein [Kiritimatiellota bacterium]MBL7016577.1 PAS domain-containing protein [Kiritimatiellales bacterium]
MTKKSASKEMSSAESALLKTKAAVPIVALGASAGGLEAFEEFFKAMPADSGMAFVLVSHLDPTHVSLLPELVQKQTAMPVEQAQDGTRAQRNCVYVIPPNKNLTILNGTFQLLDLPASRGLNLPIDLFLRALAKDQGPHAVCIILSGTGADGTLGLRAIKGELGMGMVQSEESAKYDGMPRSAISTGLADYVMPPGQMPEQLMKYIRHIAKTEIFDSSSTLGKEADALQKIYVLLRAQTNHDFSLYKKNTICRRIERRMSVHQIDDIADYVNYLQSSGREVDILFKEMLIGVTSFFRDREGFDALRDTCLPRLLEGKPDDYTIRVWVAACSSGEEAYSLAIILQECMERMHRHFNVQIFGTDLDEATLDQARAATYPESIQADVSPERLKHYFIKEDTGRYRIKPALRDMLVFAVQNVINDPPFIQLDLISCRNLLIYLGPELQKKLLRTFHNSLRPQGLLFLGQSESVGLADPSFSALDKKQNIFQRTELPDGVNPILSLTAQFSQIEPVQPAGPEGIRKMEELSAMQLVETILHQGHMPPCVIIDEACNVVYVHGRIGQFVEPAEGKMSTNILEMVRPELKSALVAAIHKVAQHQQEVVQRGLHVGRNEKRQHLDLVVKPILEQTAMRGLMMVVFQKGGTAPKKGAQEAPAAGKKERRTAEELEQDLLHTQEKLQTTIEALEMANEELKSANEELQSTNKQLQSTNEEMETSKEELQSLNEEASTVNAELKSRINDLSKINDDIKNLLDSTEIAAVFLDLDLCVRRFTPRATDIIPLTSTDEGRPIDHFSTRLMDVDLAEYGHKVLKTLAVREAEVRSKEDEIYAMKVRPYRTVNNVIDGVVITFEHITARKRAEERVMQSEVFYQTIIQSALDGFVALDDQGNIVNTNDAYCRMIGYTREELLAMSITDVEAEDGVSAERLQKKEYDRFETRQRRKDGALLNVEVSSAYCDAGSRKVVIFVREIGGKSHGEKR